MLGKSMNYDTLYENNKPIWKKPSLDPTLQKYLKLISKGKVLDLGIGEGQNSISLSQLGFDVTGIDCSKKALTICQNNCPANLTLIQQDIRNYEIPCTDYSLIMCCNVLHFMHKQDAQQIIYNMISHLKTDGFIYLKLFSIDDDSKNRLIKNQDIKQTETNVFYNSKQEVYQSYFTKQEIENWTKVLDTIFLSDTYFLDLGHANPHYHGTITYLGKTKK